MPGITKTILVRTHPQDEYTGMCYTADNTDACDAYLVPKEEYHKLLADLAEAKAHSESFRQAQNGEVHERIGAEKLARLLNEKEYGTWNPAIIQSRSEQMMAVYDGKSK